MEYPIDETQFRVYKVISGENLYAAVPKEYVAEVERLVKAHGTFEKVPSEKTVQGIFMRKADGNEYILGDEEEQSSDITINQLRDQGQSHSLQMEYRKELNAHIATINPPPGAAVKIFVHVDQYEAISELDELFLYQFDVDNNCIEFAFGERLEEVESTRYITYTTDPAVHRPPFTIQVTHQLETAHMDKYAFTVSYKVL